MPPKKHPRVGDRVGGGPQCLYCPKEFVAHFDPPDQSLIACKGLPPHTSQPGKGGGCGEEYAAAGYMQNGGLKSHLSSPASKSLRAPNASSREVGLIETEDGPVGPTLHPVCQKVDHSLLNNQTLYDGRRPPLSRDNVIQATRRLLVVSKRLHLLGLSKGLVWTPAAHPVGDLVIGESLMTLL